MCTECSNVELNNQNVVLSEKCRLSVVRRQQAAPIFIIYGIQISFTMCMNVMVNTLSDWW